MTDFTDIAYLKNGNYKQQRAYEVLTQYQVFEKLKKFTPLLAGTIPIEIDVEKSDLDIICEADLRVEEDFLNEIISSRLIPPGVDVTVESLIIDHEKSIVLNFMLEEFPVEIFAQNKPVIQQNAYRHMIAEYKILREKGQEFKQKILELKKKGMKTEPAFGLLLNLKNPYKDLLKY